MRSNLPYVMSIRALLTRFNRLTRPSWSAVSVEGDDKTLFLGCGHYDSAYADRKI